jgi:hypothetical protein
MNRLEPESLAVGFFAGIFFILIGFLVTGVECSSGAIPYDDEMSGFTATRAGHTRSHRTAPQSTPISSPHAKDAVGRIRWFGPERPCTT